MGSNLETVEVCRKVMSLLGPNSEYLDKSYEWFGGSPDSPLSPREKKLLRNATEADHAAALMMGLEDLQRREEEVAPIVGDQRKSRFRISESRGPGVRCSSGW